MCIRQQTLFQELLQQSLVTAMSWLNHVFSFSCWRNSSGWWEERRWKLQHTYLTVHLCISCKSFLIGFGFLWTVIWPRLADCPMWEARNLSRFWEALVASCAQRWAHEKEGKTAITSRKNERAGEPAKHSESLSLWPFDYFRSAILLILLDFLPLIKHWRFSTGFRFKEGKSRVEVS